jgi:exosortase A
MPPEAVSSQGLAQGAITRLSPEWRSTIGLLLFGAFAVTAVAVREWGEMLHQWWNIDTYTHILLVPVIIGWLVALKLGDLAKVVPKPWLPGLLLVGAGLALWLAGRALDINLVAHAGAVGALQGVVVAALGPRASMLLALPICFAVFLVPFGDEIIPPLQTITAEITIRLTILSGVPAEIDGIYIDTPVGLFIVAEACSGVRFLIAMVTLAVLVCCTRFDSWKRRAAFLLASIVVPVIANGIRAWGTVYIAQSQGVEFAAGFDHVFYGWFFFAFVVLVILGAAWRYFEREPEDYGWTADEVEQFAWIRRLEAASVPPIVFVAGVAALATLAAVATMVIAAPRVLG